MSGTSFAERHLSRSADHRQTAERLFDTDEEWATVAYFYACYRAVRAAFYADERLNSDAGARAMITRLPRLTALTQKAAASSSLASMR